jgi:hypothetical protein
MANVRNTGLIVFKKASHPVIERIVPVADKIIGWQFKD